MNVKLNAHISDSQTYYITRILIPVLHTLAERVSGDFGGVIEHLWIDFELSSFHARPDGKARFPFRFAKRVSGRSRFGLPSQPDSFNVGHFSVRPDYSYILSLSDEEIIPYSLKLIYSELDILKKKEKQLGGFNTESFKTTFADECSKLGYPLLRN